jgi:hypothetical protein
MSVNGMLSFDFHTRNVEHERQQELQKEQRLDDERIQSSIHLER